MIRGVLPRRHGEADRLQDDAYRRGREYGYGCERVRATAGRGAAHRSAQPRRGRAAGVAGGVGAVRRVGLGPPLAFGHMVGPRSLVAVLYALTSLALVWRRRAPVGVLAFIAIADSVVYLVYGAPEGLGSFLPLLVAFYSVGRYAHSQRGARRTADGDGDRHPRLNRSRLVRGGQRVLLARAGQRMADRPRLPATGGGDLGTGRPRAAASRRARVPGNSRRRSERARIARELHDVVGHGLSVIVLQLVAAEALIDTGDTAGTRDRIASTERSARDALAEMRRLLDLIDDGAAPQLAPQPGLSQTERLISDTRRGRGGRSRDHRHTAQPSRRHRPGRVPRPSGVAHQPAEARTAATCTRSRRLPARCRRGRGARRGAGRRRRRVWRPRADGCGSGSPCTPASSRTRAPTRGRLPRSRPDPGADVTNRIKLLIVDDETIVRDGLRAIIEVESDMEVVGQASDGVEAVAVARDRHPDVALVDIQMPRMNGVETTRRLVALPDPPRVVVLTTFDRNEYVYDSHASGSQRVPAQRCPTACQLTDAIQTSFRRRTLLSPTITTPADRAILQPPRSRQRHAERARRTDRA